MYYLESKLQNKVDRCDRMSFFGLLFLPTGEAALATAGANPWYLRGSGALILGRADGEFTA